MCGIVGVISKIAGGLYEPDLEVFEQLLMCDAVRGMDSTGSFVVTRNTQARMIKHDTHPLNLFQTDAWQHYHKYAVREGRAIIGHNRKATHGVVNNDNAHPFHEGNIVLVHNGTIHNHKGMADKDVDSHALCHSFNEIGYKETLKKVNGAWAIVWYNTKENTLYLTRNEDRPLAFIETDSEIIFASEVGMLHWIAARNHKHFKREDITVLNAFDLVTINIYPFKKTIENLKEEIKPPFVPTASNYPVPTLGGGSRPSYVPPSAHTVPASNVEPLHPLMKEYGKGALMIFVPETVEEMFEDGPRGKRFRAIGKAYSPDKPIVSARGMLPSEVCQNIADAWEYISDPKMVGNMLYIGQDAEKVSWIYLQNIRADLMEVTWHGIELPSTEYQMLCSLHKCKKCGGALDPKQASLTSIVFSHMNKVRRAICHKCVSNAKDRMLPSMKEKVEELNAV